MFRAIRKGRSRKLFMGWQGSGIRTIRGGNTEASASTDLQLILAETESLFRCSLNYIPIYYAVAGVKFYVWPSLGKSK